MPQALSLRAHWCCHLRPVPARRSTPSRTGPFPIPRLPAPGSPPTWAAGTAATGATCPRRLLPEPSGSGPPSAAATTRPAASRRILPTGYRRAPPGTGGTTTGYRTGTNAAPVFNSAIDDGKFEAPITGTFTIDDNDTLVNAADDKISSSFSIGALVRNIRAGQASTVVQTWTSYDHVIDPITVSSATANGNGGFDYVIGSRGWPTPICGTDPSGQCFVTQNAMADFNTPAGFWAQTADASYVKQIGIERTGVLADPTFYDGGSHRRPTAHRQRGRHLHGQRGEPDLRRRLRRPEHHHAGPLRHQPAGVGPDGAPGLRQHRHEDLDGQHRRHHLGPGLLQRGVLHQLPVGATRLRQLSRHRRLLLHRPGSGRWPERQQLCGERP